jgi:hypothetical protein
MIMKIQKSELKAVLKIIGTIFWQAKDQEDIYRTAKQEKL